MKTKMAYIVVVLALVCSLASIIVQAGPSIAAEDEVWVDDNYNAATPGWGTTRFNNLKDGIDNVNPGGTVHVEPGTYEANDISINKPLTITGAGAGVTIVDGQYDKRLFTVDTHTCVLSNMTLRYGSTSSHGGGIWNHVGDVTLMNCFLSGNMASTDGGGIYNEDGTLTLNDCTISDNEAADRGGGIYNEYGDVTLTNCTVSGNMAGGDGGGIHNVEGTVTLINCTVSGNKAKVEYRSAGGSSTKYIDDSDGGGIYTSGSDTLTLFNCTVFGNIADGNGGGIYNDSDEVYFNCNIVYGNNAQGTDDNIYGSYNPDPFSIVDSPNPLLGPLQNNGGPTETHALMTGSPAIDACVDCTVYINQRINGEPLETDQRGYRRPVDGDYDDIAVCDVGAYEKQRPVGGIVEPVDRLELLTPWLALAALMAVAIGVVVMRRRHVE